MRTIGRYEVLAELGRGAMGVVYKARDPKINRMVALKTITTDVADNPDLLQRFFREGQFLASLEHPNIATIYEMGEEGGTPFIAMAYVDGQTLAEVIARRLPIPLFLKLEYAIQACRAFDYAHKRGIIHRDIKPGNIMLSKQGTVKVLDFGIARVLETSHTRPGILMGTFAYMGPEVYHGEPADARSDIFSFGVVLFELICYSKPFPGENPANLMTSICLEEPRRLREIMPDSPPELDSLVERMLLKPVSERVQSMEDLLLDLEPICKSLQAETVAQLIAKSRELIQQEEFSQARDLLRQALQVDFTNAQARGLLGKVDTALKKKLLRPQAQQLVENGSSSLKDGKLDEARALANSALELDSAFEPAQELLAKIQLEASRAKLLNEKLQAARQRLAEGLLDEVDALLAPILEREATNRQALLLQEQVLEERSRRQKLHRLVQNMQRARILWTDQKYEECINLLTGLQVEFPDEEDIRKLMEAAREDRAEQHRRHTLEEARNLLAARRYGECEELLAGLRKEFPNDDEIPKLLEAVREDQARQRKGERLAEARNLLTSRRHEESITVLSELGKEFPGDDDEIAKLLHVVREDQEKQRRLQGVADARNLLAARRYEDCNTLLVSLQKQFPEDNTILELVEALREDQAQERKLTALAEARNLKGSKRYEEALSLLNVLEKDFSGDEDISKLRELVQDEWAEQRMLESLAEARDLLSSKRYEESIALLSALRKEFPLAKEISKLRELVQDEWAEQRMLESLADARDLLSSKRYEESITLLLALRKEFPLAKEISKLLATAELERAEQEKQQKLVEARTLLAAQRWEDALALLDSLLAAQPKDSTILKLKALALNEREKQARSERLQREWEDLKDLTGKEEYPAVVSRAEELLLEFPGDGNLLRLLEFAREQQAQREMAVRLSNTLDEVEGHLKANHLPEAIAGAKLGLESFPQNSDLNHLLEQAETRQKKEQTRQAIEQRVRNIKIKINREEFSDAIRMAEDAIATLGPDTDVTQLLSSAQVEYNAREKKREEDRKLESVRTLLESGNLEQATLLLDETIKSQKLDPDDPRVRRLSEDIHFAISVTESKAHPVGPPSPQQSPQREYAFLNGLPVPPDPLLAETTNQQAISAKASASQAWGLSQPVIPLPPPLDAPILIPPAEPLSQPPQRVEPKIEPKLSQPPVVTPTRRAKDKKRSSPPNPVVTAPPVSVRGAGDSSASPLHDLPVAPITQKKRPAQVRVWTSSAALGVALLGLILVASSVVLVHSLSQSMVAYKSPVSPPPPSSATPEPEPVPDEPKVIPPAPQPKGNSDTGLTALLQQEEQLWSRAKAESDGARFTQAQSELRKILALPDGGRRKDDARNFLDQVIPQREREEQLFAEAQLGLRQNDPSGLRHAADLFGQVVKLGGPRQQEAQKLQSAAQTSLEILIATDSARQALSRGDFHSARQFAGQLRQKGSDPTSLLAEINQSEQNNFAQLEISLSTLKQRSDEGALKPLEVLKTQFQTLAESDGPTAKDARRDIDNVNGAIKDLRAILITGEIAASAAAAYEGALGRYRRATDQSALEASRDEFQLIARGDSARAGDAQGLLAEINAKITALIQRAIQAAVEKYSAAFEKRDADALRNIWPYMSSVEYEGFRKSFSMAAAIHMSWSNVKIEVAPDQAMATVTIDVTQDFTPKGSKTPMRQTDHAVFHLIKQQNGTWVIKDRK